MKGSPRPPLSERSFFNVEHTASKNCTHYSRKTETHHSNSDKHILNASSLFHFSFSPCRSHWLNLCSNNRIPSNSRKLSGLAAPLIFYHKTVYHSAMCRASIYRNYTRPVVRCEVSIIQNASYLQESVRRWQSPFHSLQAPANHEEWTRVVEVCLWWILQLRDMSRIPALEI